MDLLFKFGSGDCKLYSFCADAMSNPSVSGGKARPLTIDSDDDWVACQRSLLRLDIKHTINMQFDMLTLEPFKAVGPSVLPVCY